MFTRTIILSIVVMIVPLAYAGGPQIPPPAWRGDFNGVYVGAHTGALIGTSVNKINTSLGFGGVPNGLAQNNFSYDSITKMVGGIQLGWGHEFDLFYLGFDIHGTYQDYTISDKFGIVAQVAGVGTQNVNVLTVAKLETSYGVDFRAGVLLSPVVLLFGRIGVAKSVFKLLSSTTAAIDNAGTASIIFNNNNSENVYGLRLGVGIETKATRYLSLGIEYQYTGYPTVKTARVLNTGGAINPINNFTNVHAATSGFLFNVNYYIHNRVRRRRLWRHYGRGGFNGLYLGAHGGLRRGMLQFGLHNQALAVGAATTLLSQSQQAESEAVGGFGGLQLGYGHVFHWFYLAGVIKGSFQQIHIEGADLGLTQSNFAPAFSIGTETDALLDGNYGFDIKSGVVVSPAVLLYARVGVERTRVRFQVQSVFSVVGAGTATLFSERAVDMTGLRIGLGAQTKLGKNVGVSVEYLYTTYDRFIVNNAISVSLLMRNRTAFTLKTQAFLAGIDYYFD